MPAWSNLRVTPQTRFGLDGQPYKVTQYTYYIGAHGPFTDEYRDGQDAPATVQAALQARVDKLRAIGATLPDGA